MVHHQPTYKMVRSMRKSREIDTNGEEAVPLTTKRQQRATTTPTDTTTGNAGSASSSSWRSSPIFKVVMCIAIGTFLLFVTDSVEIKGSSETALGLDSPGVAWKDDSIKANNVTASSASGSKASGAGDGQPKETQQEQVEDSVVDEVEESGIGFENTGKSNANGDNGPPNDPKQQVEEPAGNNVDDDSASTRHTYQRRGRPRSAEQQQSLVDQWGSWTLVDDKDRPQKDYYETYPHRDVPRSEFPSNAWQIDPGYLSKFLPEGIALVERAQKAILAEYGQNTTEMFDVEMLDSLVNSTNKKVACKTKCTSKGGWTTKKSWNGLKRRILHAVMTEDNFVFAMGGHSSAAGHGNHFQQSYTLQVQRILEPVFARLGVRHQSRNFGNGGLGTAHNGIAAGSIYGPDVDILMWDSGMTETEAQAKNLFSLQALMGGIKVPVLWSLATEATVGLSNKAGVDVGYPGNAGFGIRKAETFEDLETIPWAMRFMQCSNEVNSICKKNEYNGTCWIERPDFVPMEKQNNAPGGRASWHPGFRKHQITGRVLAFTFLQALKEVLVTWSESDNYELADEDWHITKYYKDMRANLNALDLNATKCSKYEENGLGFLCKYPMKGRTEFTPRAYPSYTNLRSVMPPEMVERMGPGSPPAYNPPDVFNPYIHPPPDEVDVLSIVELGPDFRSTLNPSYAERFYKKPTFSKPSKLTYGKGMKKGILAGDYLCDGSYDSWCGRSNSDKCLLYGHNDGRHGLAFDSYSGWLVMNLPDLENGYVVAKLEIWHKENSVGITEHWTSINNEGPEEGEQPVPAPPADEDGGEAGAKRRDLKKKKGKEMCNDLLFEYAIDGVVTTINRAEFLKREKKGHIQRVVQTFVLLADPTYTGGEKKEVEVGIRIRGCGTFNTFKLTHIYWS